MLTFMSCTEHNYIKAKNYYAQVLEICKEINDEDYCNRTSIRSIRITLELGDKFWQLKKQMS